MYRLTSLVFADDRIRKGFAWYKGWVYLECTGKVLCSYWVPLFITGGVEGKLSFGGLRYFVVRGSFRRFNSGGLRLKVGKGLRWGLGGYNTIQLRKGIIQDGEGMRGEAELHNSFRRFQRSTDLIPVSFHVNREVGAPQAEPSLANMSES